MKFIYFGNFDLVLPESEVVLVQNKEDKTLDVFHARDLDTVLYSVKISNIKMPHDLRALVRTLLTNYVHEENED